MRLAWVGSLCPHWWEILYCPHTELWLDELWTLAALALIILMSLPSSSSARDHLLLHKCRLENIDWISFIFMKTNVYWISLNFYPSSVFFLHCKVWPQMGHRILRKVKWRKSRYYYKKSDFTSYLYFYYDRMDDSYGLTLLISSFFELLAP